MTVSITASELIEYNYCPRFIYFMLCLNIPQEEELRYKVMKGRELHEEKLKINKDYLRKKLGATEKILNFYYLSEKLKIRGKMDEVLFLKDGTIAPLDYKYAEYHERLYSTYKHQLIIYSLLIQEYFKKTVNRAFICFILSKNYLHEFVIEEQARQDALMQIAEIFNIIETGFLPKATKTKSKCPDCCYQNICVK